MDIAIQPIQVTALNTQQPGALPPGLTAGQTVDAKVLKALANGQIQLSLANTLMTVESLVPLTPGTHVRLAVSQDAAGGLKLALVPDAQGGAQVGGPIGAPATASGAPAGPTGPVAGGAGAAGGSALAGLAKALATPNLSALTNASAGSPTPAAALAQAVQTAATRQGSLAPLMADVANLIDMPSLPAPLRDAAMQLLATRMQGGGDITAEDVQRAFTRSGTLLEAKLGAAAGGLATDSEPTLVPNMPATAMVPDLKMALVVLRQVLKNWTDGKLPANADGPEHSAGTPLQAATQGAGSPPPNGAAPPSPPYRGGPTMGQPPANPSIGPNMPSDEMGAHLLTETDAAIARTTLMQAASLPDDGGMPRTQHADMRWNFEIPIVLPQGTTIAQFEIERDGQGRAADDPERVWRVRFALDVEPMGPVHAQISFNPHADGPRTSVMLWADRADSAARLRANTQQLSEALREAELSPGDVSVRNGHPAPPAEAPPAGHFLDRAT